MDKNWMHLSDKCDPRFTQGIMAFIDFVKQHKPLSHYYSRDIMHRFTT
ncbi:unnamed protein product [Rhodiola kirilowii]